MKGAKTAVSVESKTLEPKTEMLGTLGGMALVRCTGANVEGIAIEDGIYISMGSVLMTGPFEWPEDAKTWIAAPENMLALCVKAAAVIKDWEEFSLNGIKKKRNEQ